jgi:hypothetical protein
MPPRPRATYRYRIAFDAPKQFVFRWCTDYSDQDPKIEGETYSRKILERSRRRVVYEDLEEGADGWSWARHEVKLSPPNRWHSESIGNRRLYSLDYRLTTLPDGRTEMAFVGIRRPTGLGSKNPSAAEFRRSMDAGWHKFRRELEREYRAKRTARRAR